jgi:hypothetical protein
MTRSPISMSDKAFDLICGKINESYPNACILHRPKRKMRQTFYKKIKNRSVNLFGDINALLKSIILFDDYSD